VGIQTIFRSLLNHFTLFYSYFAIKYYIFIINDRVWDCFDNKQNDLKFCLLRKIYHERISLFFIRITAANSLFPIYSVGDFILYVHTYVIMFLLLTRIFHVNLMG